MSLFDTHVHLDCAPLNAGLAAEIAAAQAVGVNRFLVPGVHAHGWDGLLQTVHAIPGAFAAPGVHPLAAAEWCRTTAEALKSLLQEHKIVAIGEIGLDALLEAPARQVQEEAFRGQLRLARDVGLPVLLHCRRAWGRLLEILREERAKEVGGILHAFSGSLETARQAVDLGFVVAFGGTLTYPGARRAPQVLAGLDQECIVLETDAPDLAPHPYRGDSNRPAWLALIAAEVARQRGWSLAETTRITTDNALRVLKIKDGPRPSGR